MLHQSLVNASDVAAWADRNQAADHLPKLIRRLVLATTRVERIEMPSEEGVHSGGYDGVTSTENGNAFVPDGTSAWEMGKEANPKGKADNDYLKRTAAPGDLTPLETTFIFVTPRRWSKKGQWARARTADAKWRQVRAYDADDLTAWLETAPAVHIWFSLLLGKRPAGCEDLGRYWEGWSAVTAPPVSAEMLLAGRTGIVRQMREWMAGTPSAVGLRTDTAEEATALTAAVVHTLPEGEREIFLSRTLVTDSADAFRQISGSGSGLVLVPQMVEPRLIAEAVHNGHHVIVPLGRDEPSVGTTIDVPRLRRDPIEEALRAQGVVRDLASEAATLARRSLTAFRRLYSRYPDFRRPAWAEPSSSRAVLPALLAERWDEDIAGDREALSLLAGTSYEAFRDGLVGWAGAPDAPVRRTGSVWSLASKEDALRLAGGHLTDRDLDTFAAAVRATFGRHDPVWDLEPDRRFMAGVLGASSPYSAMLKTGLTDTLAAFAARGGVLLTGARDVAARTERLAREIVESAGDDWRLWASLSHYLPLLAEAAPDAVLETMEKQLDAIVSLFAPSDNILLSPTPHVGILWALETVAWDPDRLGRVANLLARLARLDPGANSNQGNRPGNSLREIFRCWYPQTAATLPQRLRVIEALRRREPDVSWSLLTCLVPYPQATAHPTHQPKWREWVPDSEPKVPVSEIRRSTEEATTYLLSDVGADGMRWKSLMSDIFPHLPSQDRARVVGHLASPNARTFAPADAALVKKAVRNLVADHREFAEQDWAMPPDEVDALESVGDRIVVSDSLEEVKWLFNDYPRLPGVRFNDEDGERHAREAAALRLGAITGLLAEGGLGRVVMLADVADSTWTIGKCLGANDLLSGGQDRDLLQQCLLGDHAGRRSLAHAFIVAKFDASGWAWADAHLDSPLLREAAPSYRAAFYRGLPCLGATWRRLEREVEEIQNHYWQTWGGYRLDEPEEYVPVVTALLRHGQPLAAAQLVRKRRTAGTGFSVPTPLVVEVLDRVAQAPAEHWRSFASPDYHVAELLDELDESGEVPEDVLSRIEWQFLPILRNRRLPTRLHRRLSSDPAMFVEALSLVFPATQENSDPSDSEARAARARYAYDLLESWRRVPGLQEDGSLSSQELASWLHDARAKAMVANVLALADHYIGCVLTFAPSDSQESWPHTAVRDAVEEIASEKLELGFEQQVCNSRGPTWRDPTGGGSQERELVESYAGYARVTGDLWPRTAAMLRRIAASYERQAEWQDDRASLTEDLWQ